ncbi:MAG: hypothetical protein JWN39_1394 [Ilumatobacteraceae bacterium]|nr:hypothetical protein [Ilumatobacteraceae bacterium]
MPLELRPAWCLADQAVSEAIVLGPWVDEGGGLANALDGDAWRPGGSLQLRRVVEMKVDPIDLRRRLGLRAGAVVGIAARWSCRATATAGVHQGGPASINLGSESILTIDVPSTIASAIEIETCLVVNWAIS